MACGLSYTIAISQDGQQVFGFGKGIDGSFGLATLDREVLYTPMVTKPLQLNNTLSDMFLFLALSSFESIGSFC